MIKQILRKDLPEGLGKGFVIFMWPPGSLKDIYFEVDNWTSKETGFWDYVDQLSYREKDCPRGVMSFKALDNERFLRASYDPREVTEQHLLEWLRTKFS